MDVKQLSSNRRHLCAPGPLRDHAARGGARLCRAPFRRHDRARAGTHQPEPVRHIDLVGTIMVPIAILRASKLAAAAGFLFGWAKPVPVNYSALRKPRQHMRWVAAAGPGANLVMALGWALLLKLALVAAGGRFRDAVASSWREAGIVSTWCSWCSTCCRSCRSTAAASSRACCQPRGLAISRSSSPGASRSCCC